MQRNEQKQNEKLRQDTRESVIVKGIATNILDMDSPNFNSLRKYLSLFGYSLESPLIDVKNI